MLTIFIVVLTPLTFITGFFGMNVHFPGFNSVGAFLASVVLMIAVSIGMIGFFRWKKWL